MNRHQWIEGEKKNEYPDWKGYHEGSMFYVAGSPHIFLKLERRGNEFWIEEDDDWRRTRGDDSRVKPDKIHYRAKDIKWDRIIAFGEGVEYESIQLKKIRVRK